MAGLRKYKRWTGFFVFAVFVFSTAPAFAALTHEDAKEVWGKIAKVTDLTSLPFDIKEEKSPNAWVTNGKSVTVTTGLLNLLETRSELYGVLAHEAGHAKLGHYESTVKRNTGVGVAAAILGSILGSNIGSVAVNVGANLAVAGWSREQEVEADDYSVHLAHKNGEDPVGLYSAMQRISAYGGKTEPSGFNSHPPDDRRLLHIRNEIRSLDPDAKFPDVDEIKAHTPKASEEETAEAKPQPAPPTTPTNATDATNLQWEALKKEVLAREASQDKN